jgi:hypothetical protein
LAALRSAASKATDPAVKTGDQQSRDDFQSVLTALKAGHAPPADFEKSVESDATAVDTARGNG